MGHDSAQEQDEREDDDDYVRDALTGAKVPRHVLAHSLILRDRGYAPRIERNPANDQPIGQSDVPTSIDSSQPYPQGHLGGKRWTRPFSRYISPVLPNDQAQLEKEKQAWWQGSFGRERVRQRFLSRYGDLEGEIAWAAALSILRLVGGPDFQDVLQRASADFHRPVGYVHQMWKLAHHFAYAPSAQLDAEEARYSRSRKSRVLTQGSRRVSPP